MSQKQGQESTNYIDGVKVKISEKYKPPPRINLVMTYSQRLSLNKQIQDNMPNYEFNLEKKIIVKLNEYKAARKLNLEERSQRLDRVKEARKKFEEKLSESQKNNIQNESSTSSTSNSVTTQYGNVTTSYETNSNILIPTQVTSTSTNILTPTVSNRSEYVNLQMNDKSPFNISDFEADTSSPFDNVELKTINDMEELALVLKSEETSNTNINNQQYNTNFNSSYSNYTSSAIPSYPCNIQSTSSYGYNRTNGYNYYNPYLNNYNYKTPYIYNTFDQKFNSTTKEKNNALKTVPDIMKDLQTELNNSHINHKGINNISLSNNITSNQTDQSQLKEVSDDIKQQELENPFNTLPKELQTLSKNISSMGFPLDRVARACTVLGNDHKKIVEYLLAMSELLDLGFPENKVSKALLQSNNDRDKALDILIL